MASTIQLFEQASHARIYSKFRPTYPKALLDILTGYLVRSGSDQDTVVDIGCGSGQSTFYLQDSFKHCIGVDISKAQVQEAQKKCEEMHCKNVEFRVGNGMDLPMETASANAVTIAQAWHWMANLEKFYSECKRILKPHGCLAVYGYGNVHLKNELCNQLVRDFYKNTLTGCWHKERCHIDNEYAEVDLPFSNVERHDIEMPKTYTVEDFIGYVSTWSGYEKYCAINPNNTVLQDLQEKISEHLSSNNTPLLDAKFPVFMIIGQHK